jgi:O-antigen ligase
MRQGGARDFVEPQYYRGQHSSVVNVFYRMGIIGGVLFVLINAGALLLAYRGIGAAADPIQRRHCFIALVLLVTQIVQMSIHVGLETPRFILLYVLSIGLVVFAFLQTQFATAFRVAVPSELQAEPINRGLMVAERCFDGENTTRRHPPRLRQPR